MAVSNSPADGMVCSRQTEMAAFDRLPQELRQLLTQTRVQWSALSVERLMHSQRLPVAQLVRRLLQEDERA